jgi:S-adenosylmethionine synthetase
MPDQFVVKTADAPAPDDRSVEIVERKGLGHPDTICDALAEELSLDLCRFYVEHAGAILHHNVDKALLVAGHSEPRFGGGRVVMPMHVMLAGRATTDFGDLATPVAELADQAVRRWLTANLRAIDAERHVEVSSLVRPGSSELVGLFDEERKQRRALSNDTSCGVGFAPLSQLEHLVLVVEAHLRSDEARAKEPALGEDIKVMAVRHEEKIHLTISCAMIDAALEDMASYTRARENAAQLALEVAQKSTQLPVDVSVNAADDIATGRIFLTVTGTSAESGDDGQAGRGNRVNGLITPGRPMTIESVAGKNPVTHVGKLYNLTAGLAAQRLVDSLPEVSAAECRLVSRIGSPIEEPQLVEVRLVGPDPEADRELVAEAERIVRDELTRLPTLADELLRGRLKLDRWPLMRD